MPSIQEIANKTKNKMFKQTDTRHLEEVLPTTKTIRKFEDQANEAIIMHSSESSVKPFTNIQPEETLNKTSNNDNIIELQKSEIVPLKQLKKEFIKVDYRPWDDDKPADKSSINKGSPGRIITSLYGVQRSIVKFLIEHIDYEEGQYFYTLPIDIRSIVMFTSSSKFTVETSLRRLKEKSVIESWDHKRGRGGYVTFRILKKLHDEFLNSKNTPIQPIMK